MGVRRAKTVRTARCTPGPRLDAGEAAEQLARLAWIRHGERVGVNADMIAKWERGEKSPSPRYRELLCLLYGATPEYLGIARPTRSKASPAPTTASPAVTEHGLVDALGGAAAILDQLGSAGGIRQPRMFEAWKEDVMRRRTALKLMGIMPSALALSSVAESARRARSGRPTPENINDLEHLADRYQALYHCTDPAALMTPVVAHLSTLGDLLRQDPAPAEHRRELGVALGRLSRSAVKQRAVFLADLATVELHDGNLDHACTIAADAASQLHQPGYATGVGRLRDLRVALEPWKTPRPSVYWTSSLPP
ncbi:MAG: helix-turn-helix domain-containing protein [Actinomycetota bacterium]|nr:helix-turn-helix domain-containing protein [Actinomycetota bacterium]